jgi:menaquinone-dependent protoporphyrinogen oxidase
MTVLMTYATAQGSTRGIAERIAARLRESGFAVDLAPVESAGDPAPYEAVVLGSAIHSGDWLPAAHAFVQRHADALRQRPVWLFSVSSIGETSSFLARPVAKAMRRLARQPAGPVAAIQQALGARGFKSFAGAIERGAWGGAGNLFLRLMGGRYGDHRDWAAIDRWAAEVAAQLKAPRAAAV